MKEMDVNIMADLSAECRHAHNQGGYFDIDAKTALTLMMALMKSGTREVKTLRK